MNQNAQLLHALIGYVEKTRRYGHTYVHASVRQQTYGWEGVHAKLDNREVKLTYTGWGRSLSSGGHKYKAHARFSDSGKPVRSKDLLNLIPA